jgi:hypothetical protein
MYFTGVGLLSAMLTPEYYVSCQVSKSLHLIKCLHIDLNAFVCLYAHAIYTLKIKFMLQKSSFSVYILHLSQFLVFHENCRTSLLFLTLAVFSFLISIMKYMDVSMSS